MAFLYPDKSMGLANERFQVRPEAFIIGRQAECDLPLPVDSVSRQHTRIAWEAPHWVLTDLGSSNGTFVNGRQVSESVNLKDGDIITLGKAALTFRTTASSEGPVGDDLSSGLRIAGDDDSSSVILSTQLPDRTPYLAEPTGADPRDHLDRLNQRLLALYRHSDLLRNAGRREEIVQTLLDVIFDILPADRGVVLRLNEGMDEPVAELFHFREGGGHREMMVSRTILNRAINERLAVLSRDVHTDTRLQNSESMMASDIRSAMCVPLSGKRRLMGVLFLDTREACHCFTEDDLAFVSALATDAAMSLENLELMELSLRQERLAAVGQTISGLAHNIKNILQLARGGTELMNSAIAKRSFDEIETLWPITRRSIERMQTLTEEMLDFSRPATVNLSPTDLNEIIKHLAEIITGEAEKLRIALQLDLDPACGRPMVDPDALTKALLNLLTNAFDALKGSSDAHVRLVTTTHHGHPVIHVIDNGPGIPAENQTQVFQPFFSTKASQGNGLGLSMTRKYIEDMGGRLELCSKPGAGCRFTILLSGG